MTTAVGLWTRLTNDHRSIHVASGDWEHILMSHGTLAPTTEDRWSQEDSTWLWTAQEALALADALVSGGAIQCIGSLKLDLKISDFARGTGHNYLDDGRTPQQRTAHLIQFLREGSFRWRFVTGPSGIVPENEAR